MTNITINDDFRTVAVPLFRKGSFSKQLKDNPTGAGYFACNVGWMLAGYLTTGVDVVAGFTNFVGSSSRLKINPEYKCLGKQNWDSRLGASAGALSTAISTLPAAVASFATGDYITFGAIVANDALIAAAQYVDFKSGELQGLDRSKYSKPMAALLANPRYYAGLGRAASRLLPIGISLASGNIPVALAFVALGAVDLYYTRTKAVTEFGKAKTEVTNVTAPAATHTATKLHTNRPLQRALHGKQQRPRVRLKGVPKSRVGKKYRPDPTYSQGANRPKLRHGSLNGMSFWH